MKDNMENKLDDLFDSNNKKTKKLIWRAKIKSIVLIVLITGIILSVLYGVASKFSYDKIMNKINMELNDKNSIVSEEIKQEYEIMHPDRYLGPFTFQSSFISGRLDVNTYKIIGQNIVPTEPIERNFNLKEMNGAQTTQDLSINKDGKGISTVSPGSLHDKLKNVDFFNVLGQRKMIFFYPFSDYKDLYRNDIIKLDEVDNKKMAEIAISFDKYYSIGEVQNIIPSGINISWYWVDSLSEEQKSQMLNSDEKDTNSIREGYDGTRKDGLFRRVVSEDTAIGIKAVDMNGFKIDKPEDKFVESLYKNPYKDDNVKYLKSILDIKEVRSYPAEYEYKSQNIKIGGVVVTGSIDELKALKTVPNIKASTFGVITDKY